MRLLPHKPDVLTGIISVLPTVCFISNMMTGCKHFAADEHPSFFSSFIKKVDTSSNEIKEAALASFDSAFNAFPNPGTGDYFSRDSLKRDYYSYVKRDYRKAMTYADSMILMVKDRIIEEKYAQRYAKALFYKGDCYSNLKKYDDAFRLYLEARKVITTYVRDKCSMAEHGGNTGNILFAQRHFISAAAQYLQHYKDQEQCGQDNHEKLMERQASLTNAGLSFYHGGNIDSAWYCYNKALEIINVNENKFSDDYYATENAKGVIYGNIAEVLDRRMDYKNAEKYFQKSYHATKSADKGYTQRTQLRLAAMYVKSNQTGKAQDLLQRLRKSLDTLPDEQHLINWYKLNQDVYENQNNTGMAYAYLKKHIRLKDSMDARDREFAALDVSREFERMEQQAINEKLRQENDKQSLYLLISVISGILFIVIILLVWYHLIRSGKYVKQLERLNKKILFKNEDLQTAFISLERSHDENTHIMKVVAHDLKNPISAMNNLIQTVLMKETSPVSAQMLELAASAGKDSIVLINDLLTDKSNSAENNREMVDMQRLLENCVSLMQQKADEKKQVLKLQMDPAVVWLDRQKIWRALSNIITNAIKFSPEKSVIQVRMEKKINSVLLSVKDTGIGIPAELKDKIFSLTSEASRAGTSGEQSYGLGLSISRKIVEEHKGKLWFESNPGAGSVFFIELPFAA